MFGFFVLFCRIILGFNCCVTYVTNLVAYRTPHLLWCISQCGWTLLSVSQIGVRIPRGSHSFLGAMRKNLHPNTFKRIDIPCGYRTRILNSPLFIHGEGSTTLSYWNTCSFLALCTFKDSKEKSFSYCIRQKSHWQLFIRKSYPYFLLKEPRIIILKRLGFTWFDWKHQWTVYCMTENSNLLVFQGSTSTHLLSWPPPHILKWFVRIISYLID